MQTDISPTLPQRRTVAGQINLRKIGAGSSHVGTVEVLPPIRPVTMKATIWPDTRGADAVVIQ